MAGRCNPAEKRCARLCVTLPPAPIMSRSTRVGNEPAAVTEASEKDGVGWPLPVVHYRVGFHGGAPVLRPRRREDHVGYRSRVDGVRGISGAWSVARSRRCRGIAWLRSCRWRSPSLCSREPCAPRPSFARLRAWRSCCPGRRSRAGAPRPLGSLLRRQCPSAADHGHADLPARYQFEQASDAPSGMFPPACV